MFDDEIPPVYNVIRFPEVLELQNQKYFILQ